MSTPAFNPLMRRTPVEIAADRTAATVRRRLVEDLGRMREDAGVSLAALARAAGVPPAYVWRIFNGNERPSIETYARLASVLGADLSARCYPTTGPTIRDRHQARIEEGLLRALAVRWRPLTEVGVRRPVRGWIDLALHEPRDGVVVATEIESQLNRLEQQVRWSTAKAEALPSWPGWPALGDPRISRLLVVRLDSANAGHRGGVPAPAGRSLPGPSGRRADGACRRRPVARGRARLGAHRARGCPVRRGSLTRGTPGGRGGTPITDAVGRPIDATRPLVCGRRNGCHAGRSVR